MAEFLIKSNPRVVSPAAYRALLVGYLEAFELAQIEELLLSQKCPKDTYSFVVSAVNLIQHDPSLAYTVLYHPRLLLPIFENALSELQERMAAHDSFLGQLEPPSAPFSSSSSAPFSIKRNVRVRIASLPPTKSMCKSTIGQIHSTDGDTLLQISGTVVRTGPVRMLELSKEYQCQSSKCGFRWRVVADPEQGYTLPVPRRCPAVAPGDVVGDVPGKGDRQCPSTQLREVEGTRTCVDYQEVKIQDRSERLPLGYAPRSMLVILEADLVDRVHPGDDIVLVGTLIRQWRRVVPGVRLEVDLALHANHVKLKESQQRTVAALVTDMTHKYESFWAHYRGLGKTFEGRNRIVKAMCPQLYGLYFVKLALLLTLIGGGNGGAHETDHTCTGTAAPDVNPNSADQDYPEYLSGRAAPSGDNPGSGAQNGSPLEVSAHRNNGFHRRTQSHILMIGDPGTGKSQLLRFAAALIPRSVTTTGIGTSSAGLTCTAVKDAGGGWSVEAGALVLSNDGVCCIDEFASLREHDRAAIHEAMEQQSISVAKAGMVVRLSSRATVVAACNPKGSYDTTVDISTNTGIASPLLSRFDLVLVLVDRPEKQHDIKISRFVLEQSIYDGCNASRRSGMLQVAGLDGGSDNDDDDDDDEYSSANGARRKREGSVWDMLARKNARRNGVRIAARTPADGSKEKRDEHHKLYVRHSYTGESTTDGRRVQDLESWDLQWGTALLRDYVMLLRSTPAPPITAEATALLQRYYQQARLRSDSQAGRTTVRLLESLVRLSVAHAKLCWRQDVQLADAVVAVYCVHCSQSMADGQASFLGAYEMGMGQGGRGGFPDEAEVDYEACRQYIFTTLNYTDEMLRADVGVDASGGVSTRGSTTQDVSEHWSTRGGNEGSEFAAGMLSKSDSAVSTELPRARGPLHGKSHDIQRLGVTVDRTATGGAAACPSQRGEIAVGAGTAATTSAAPPSSQLSGNVENGQNGSETFDDDEPLGSVWRERRQKTQDTDATAAEVGGGVGVECKGMGGMCPKDDDDHIALGELLVRRRATSMQPSSPGVERNYSTTASGSSSSSTHVRKAGLVDVGDGAADCTRALNLNGPCHRVLVAVGPNAAVEGAGGERGSKSKILERLMSGGRDEEEEDDW